MANSSKTHHTNFYQNRSTFAEIMYKSILVCFYAPLVYIQTTTPASSSWPAKSSYCSRFTVNDSPRFAPIINRPSTSLVQASVLFLSFFTVCYLTSNKDEYIYGGINADHLGLSQTPVYTGTARLWTRG